MTSDLGKSVLTGYEKLKIINGNKMGSLKLPSLDSFNDFDPLGKEQDRNDLVAALSINEETLREGITSLSRDESELGDLCDNRNVFYLFDNKNKDNDG